MGRVADVFGSSPTAHKEAGKAKEKRKEEKAQRSMTMGLISAEWPLWLRRGTKEADRLHLFWCISMPRLHKAIDEYQR